MRNYFSFIFLVFSVFSQVALAGQSFNVTFINPSNDTDSFWNKVTQMMKYACEDLNCNLHVMYSSHRNHLLAVSRLDELPTSTDYVVFQSTKGNGIEILKKAERKKIKSFMFNAVLSGEQQGQYGEPRSYFKYWLGQMFPNDKKAGFNTAMALVDEGRKISAGNNLTIVAFNGIPSDGAAVERIKGLEDYIRKNSDSSIQQIISARWLKDIAEQKFNLLHKRYPDIQLFWAAGDAMAEGVIAGAEKMGLTPGKDILTTGVDWNNTAIKEIKQGKMVASAGGHFMEGAWVIVLLADYHNKIDFKKEALTFKSAMSLLTSKNIDLYINKFQGKDLSKIDFKKFSKFYNKSLGKYDFNFDKVLEQLE
ncbi:ABC-type sugar transport system, periplasmic component [Piscirickettsia salmonis]|uniref:ABC transporter substrate-binding protein n=1 Tax=Piscirickettsia salmonis TaxID=1238 RepID=UPI0012BA67F5|nr:ABC transporter substrate-binding protein [Piscirickettsia salmonis]QGP53326.1 ABC-type sugar transport system, periplasmic component [Piscirickettsia salmonis]QGP60756.1 ABC-type sugar transport system, periplasmic component [Piscirickettsia salmonis]QGP62891.1 ABC-type sugar transport system, periplasmic component [Piscirickettsia salmonis]